MCCENGNINGNFTYLAFASDYNGSDFSLSKNQNNIVRNYQAIFVSSVELDINSQIFQNYFHNRWFFMMPNNSNNNPQLQSNQYDTNNITFKSTIGDYFGKVSLIRTGVLTFDFTDAVTGAISVVYYQNATLQMPSVWRQKGDFIPNVLNKIYLERDSEGYITANIVPPTTVIILLPNGVTNLTLTEETFGVVIPLPNGITALVLTEETFGVAILPNGITNLILTEELF